MNIRLLLIDDFPLIREGFAAALEADPGLKIVGQADIGDEGLRLARELQPDVVVLDLAMPGMGGMTVLENLRADAPEAKVLVVTATEKPQPLLDSGTAATALLNAGAHNVVGARWDVSSAATRQFMAAFYDGLAAGNDVHCLKRARTGRKLVFAGLQCGAAARQGCTQLKGAPVPDNALLRQQGGDIGEAGVGRDHDRAWFRQRARRGHVAVKPITGSSEDEEDERHGDRRPCQEAKKAAHRSAGFSLLRASSVQGGPTKISEALVPPKPKELESA